jgi:hypothetical protein
MSESDPIQGLPPGNEPIAPLTAETFVERLTSLTQELRALRAMRQAMVEQHPEHGGGPSEDH